MSTATPIPTAQRLVEFLQDPGSYAEHPATIELVETHISWVFLTDHYAYKLKKPVQFPFLDFAPRRARRLACVEEVRLNRRLARNVYLGLVPITFDPSRGLELDGCGQEVDCLIKMRRLPADRALDHLIRLRRLGDDEITAVSNTLVEFYTNLPPRVLQPQDHHQHLVNHCQANLTALLGTLAGTRELLVLVKRIHSAQKRYLTLQEDLFYARVRDGRIVDGHGDLRAEHIFLESPPAVIDCVEFSTELREVDVLDDLSFLAMDCQRLGNGALGKRLFEAFQRASGDVAPDTLIAFYKSYRASVRAKVAALQAAQAAQVDESEQKRFLRQHRQYLNWADYYAAQLGPPALVITGGLMGSGKSTLASQVADAIGAELISTDQIRRSLFGSSKSPAAYDSDIYHSDLRRSVYTELLSRAESVLDEGRSVVLDGAFLTNTLRRAALELGRRHGARGCFVECECPKETAIARIATRAETGTNESEARPELYDQQLKEHEAPDSAIPFVCVDSITSLHEEQQVVFATLRAHLFAG